MSFHASRRFARARRALPALAAAVTALAMNAAPVPAAMPDFGPMRPYQLALIRRGPSWTPGRTPLSDSLQKGHMANISAMAAAGKLIAAGPFLDDGNLRGIYVFTADSAEAAAMAASDPAVRAGRLVLELHPMMARADIGVEYRERLAKNPATKDSMVNMSLGLLIANPGRDADPKVIGPLMEQHLWHLKREMDQGRLRVAGPLLSTGPIRGILIFDSDTTAARKSAETDPMVKGGWIRLELHPWMTAHGVIPSQ